MNLKRLMAILLSALFIQASCATYTDEPLKRVECTVEIMPNYIWHLFAISNLWDIDNSPYGERYGYSVPAEDISFLHQNREYIIWGHGRASEFTRLLFFIPFSHDISPDDYFAYLDNIDKAAGDGDWLSFLEKYCPRCIDANISFEFSDEQITIFRGIADIIKSNYSFYRDKIWGDVEKYLEKEKDRIDSAFHDQDIIHSWEMALEMKYPGEGFYPVLTYANGMDNLPSANNLSDSRNNFGVPENSTQYNIDLIIHEIGVFALMPVILLLFADDSLQTKFIQENGITYQAIESFIEYKKEGITGSRKIWEGELFGGGTFNFPWFFRFYEQNEDTYDSRDLIYNAILEYEKENT